MGESSSVPAMEGVEGVEGVEKVTRGRDTRVMRISQSMSTTPGDRDEEVLKVEGDRAGEPTWNSSS